MRLETLEPRLALAAIQEWSERGVGGGGALFSPSFNPANPDEMYIASDMGQVFHTTNEGVTWQTVDFRELQGSNNSKVQFTADPQILYSLDYSTGGDQVCPTKSSDGGLTWTPLASDPTGGEAFTIVADYQNPQRILVSDYNRIFISTNGGASFAQRYSTSDGAGAHLAGAFFDGNNIYVGTNQGVLVSTNNGASFGIAPWTGIPSGQRILSFAGAKEEGVTRFWVVTADAADVYAGVPGSDHSGYAGVYRLDLGQTAWTSITSGISSGASPFFVSAALNDIDTVYVSGGSTSSRPTVFKSTNGGSAWTSVLNTINNGNVQTGWSGDGGNRGWSYGENAMGFTVSPLDPSRVLITDFGFAHYSEDGGASWRALYVNPADLNPAGASISAGETYRSSGLDNTTVWGMTWTSPTQVIANNSDIRGVQSSDGGASWGFNYTGHTANSMYRSFVHPTTGVVYAATASVHDMYQSTHLTDASINGGTGSVLFSTNGGTTWQTMRNFGRVVTWVEADPTNANRLYASVAHSSDGGIYVTNNAGAGAAATWTRLAAPPRTEGHAFNIRVLQDGTLVVSYSGRRTSSGFTPSSGVFVSTDGGASWQDRSHTGMRYWTKDVVIDPHDATQNTWYASVFSGWGGAPNGLGGLYRTTDRGVSWTRISALDRVNSITVSPTDPNEAYLTTEVEGLWHTDNLRAATPVFTQVAGYPFMQPMRVEYNPFNTSEVWVTSFGGGMRVGYASATPPPQPGSLSFAHATYTVSEDGGSLLVSVARTGGASGAVSVSYATADGVAIAGQDYAATSGLLQWGDGESGTRTFGVPLLNDGLYENPESFSIALSNPEGGAALGAPSTTSVTIQSEDARPTLSFSAASFQVLESIGQAIITVVRGGNFAGPLTVAYSASAGTATSGDFTPTSGTLAFAAGETSQTFSVAITNDTSDEAVEVIALALAGASGGVELAPHATALLQILDDDEPPPPPPGGSIYEFESAAYSTREDYGYRSLYIRRGGDVSQPGTVAYSTQNGTALAGADYIAQSGTVSFAAGQTSNRIDISLVNDNVLEPAESFSVVLSAPTGGNIGTTGATTVTIADDEVVAAGVIQFDRATFNTREDYGYANIYLTRTGGTGGAVTVQFAVSPGTAQPGEDYQPVIATISFAAGQKTATARVYLVNDLRLEPLETAQLTLTNPTNGATLGQRASATLRIADDEIDSPGELAFNKSSYSTVENWGYARIYVERTVGYVGAVSVSYSVGGGTAVAGVHYTPVSGVLTFAAGEYRKYFDIPLINNKVSGGTHTLEIYLSSPTGGARLGPKAQALLTILDDE